MISSRYETKFDAFETKLLESMRASGFELRHNSLICRQYKNKMIPGNKFKSLRNLAHSASH